MHDTAPANQLSRLGRTQETDLQLKRGSELAIRQRSDQGRTQRVIEHRGQEPALEVAHRVGELLASLKTNLDLPPLGIHR
jgi:hypothetical protein